MVVPTVPSPPGPGGRDPFLVNRIADDGLAPSASFEVEPSEWDLDGFPDEAGDYGL